MHAIATNTIGSVDNIKVVDLPTPEPGPGQVRVRVHASAVNPADYKVLDGQFFGRFLHNQSLPLIPGYDFSGEVDAVGPGVTDLAPGDRVWGHQQYESKTRHGCFAELTVIDRGATAKLPDEVEHATAAAAATAGLTALQAIRDQGGFTSGTVLVIGASGGVGSVAVGVAKRLGAEVTGVCSTHAVDFVRGLGADHVIDRKAGDPYASGGPYNVVFDTSGMVSYGMVRKRMAAGGAYVTTLPSPSFVVGKVQGLLSGHRCGFVVVRSIQKDLAWLGQQLVDGMTVPIESRFAAKDTTEALASIKTGGRQGRIVIDVIDGW